MSNIRREISDFFKLEKSLDIDQLMYRKFNMWAFYRNYYGEKFVLNNNPIAKTSSSLFKTGIKSLTYGFSNLFRSYDYVAIVASNQRKKSDERYIHPFDFLPKHIKNNLLIVELPVEDGHYPISKLEHKKVISRFWFLIFEYVIMFFLPVRRYKKYEQQILDIESKLGVQCNYNYLNKRFEAGYIFMKYFLKIYKPKAVYCTVLYPILNYSLAAKEANIPVIEMQHGYVGEKHRAYNITRDLGELPKPDYFLSWGRCEEEFLASDQNFFINKNKVIPVGNFYLNLINNRSEHIKEQIKNHKINSYKVKVAVSIQDPLEDIILPFIDKASRLDTSVAYLLLPRAKKHSYYLENFEWNENVFLIDELNTYEGIVISDVHTTMWSTTAFESLALGKPNVMINVDDLALGALGELLTEDFYTKYSKTPEEFVVDVEKVIQFSSNNIQKKAKYFFNEEGIETRLRFFVNEILSKN